MKPFTFLFLLFFSFSLFAADLDENEKTSTSSNNQSDSKKDKEQKDEDPWFAGTLLSFYPLNAEPCQYSIQATFLATRFYGIYDAHSSISTKLNSHVYTGNFNICTGLIKNIDLTLDFYATQAHTSTGSAIGFGDITAYLGFQLSKDDKKSWVPDSRVCIGEVFPTGRSSNLDPNLLFADATGTGAYSTFIVFIARKIYYIFPRHPFNWCINIGFFHAGPADVSGMNFYGGDPDTVGRVNSSEGFIGNLGFEYKFNKRWGCGIDVHGVYQNYASFGGISMDLFAGTASSYNLSLAPIIEYNYSENLGWDIGLWFSVKGRNEFAFFSGAYTLFYVF